MSTFHAVPGLDDALSLVRKACGAQLRNAGMKSILASRLLSGAAMSFLATYRATTSRPPDNVALRLAALVEMRAVLLHCRAQLISGQRRSPRILGYCWRAFRFSHRAADSIARLEEGPDRRSRDRLVRLHRRICEAEVAFFSSRDRAKSEAFQRLTDFLRAFYTCVSEAAAPADEEGAAGRFGDHFGAAMGSMLEVRHHLLNSDPSAAQIAKRRVSRHLAAVFEIPAYQAHVEDLLPILSAQADDIEEGRWDSLLDILDVRPEEPPRELHRGLSPSWKDPIRETIAKALVQHLEISGSLTAKEISETYSVPHGKLLRGWLVMCFSRLCGGELSKTLPVAVAVEELHLASLVIDDVLDQSEVRHGRATLAKRYGPQIAVAVGSHYACAAVEALSREGSVGLLDLLDETAAAMFRGQSLEPKAGKLINWPRYEAIVAGKTAALFSFACAAGAQLGGGDPKLCEDAGQVGKAYGMAFQIIDDYLDYFGGPGFGKKVGGDFLGGLATAPLLELIDLQPPGSAPLIEMFRAGFLDLSLFEQVRAMMIEHGIPERVRRRALAHVEAGRKRIAAFPALPERDRLDELMQDVVRREY